MSSLLLQSTLPVALLGIIIEASFGYPDWVFRKISHPVVWIGSLISLVEHRLNKAAYRRSWRLMAGCLACVMIVGVTVGCAATIDWTTRGFGYVVHLGLCSLLASSLIAQRSLYTHVCAVGVALRQDGLESARIAVSRIVGRDPSTLDEAAVLRAAIESLAENFSDGVVAPVVWCAAAGLPGIVLYKTINTADSMIGHITPRYEAFGKASARIDDIINIPASRLAVFWILCACLTCKEASIFNLLRCVMRDAHRHRSPNAGWPEAAFAGALGLRLAGPRSYHGKLVMDHWMGDGVADITVDALDRALILYRRACVVQAIAIACASLLVLWI